MSLAGEHHFNEVHLDGVFVPDELVLGELGDGWAQVTSELAYERSGPERFLSTSAAAAAALARTTGGCPRDAGPRAARARLPALRQMSFAVSTRARGDEHADRRGSRQGPRHDEARSSRRLRRTCSERRASDDRLEMLLAAAIVQRPGFTLRGGTNEILRGIIARGLGVR